MSQEQPGLRIDLGCGSNKEGTPSIDIQALFTAVSRFLKYRWLRLQPLEGSLKVWQRYSYLRQIGRGG